MEGKADFLPIVTKLCSERSLDSDLICALIQTESAWNPYAVRFELSFQFIENPAVHAKRNGITQKTERYLQKFSWGLGQIMGGTARGLGYRGPLTQLVDPEVNIELIGEYFIKRCLRYSDEQKQIAAYNAGSVVMQNGRFINEDYVLKVTRSLKDIRSASSANS